MKKIKDFIYDYNDVLVALLIVVVAGFIIFWRVNVVMSYADVATGGDVQQIDIDFSNIDLGKEVVEDIKEPEVEPEEVTEGGIEEGSAVEPENTSEGAVETVPETPVVEVKKYTIEISKKAGTTNWTSAGKLLQEQGIIEDYKAFVARVVERKADTALQLGKYEVDSSMTTDKIIDLLMKK